MRIQFLTFDSSERIFVVFLAINYCLSNYLHGFRAHSPIEKVKKNSIEHGVGKYCEHIRSVPPLATNTV